MGIPDGDPPCPRRPVPAGLEGHEIATPPAGWIDPIPRPRRWLGRPVRFQRLDRLTRLALVAAHAAVEAAAAPDDLPRAGIVLGTALGSHLTNEAFQLQLDRRPPPEASPTLFTHTLPSAAVGVISIHLGLRGPTVTLAEGVCAGLAALDLAGGMLARGEVSWVLAGAVDSLGPTRLAAAGADAGLLAEGAAFFCLSGRADNALARVGPAVQRVGRADAVEQEALERAGLRRDELREHHAYHEVAPAAAEAPRFERVFGRSAAAAPLLGVCALVGAASLPALISVHDAGGRVSALCLDVPRG